MILVDTSVWIEYFRESNSSHAQELQRLIAEEEDLALADLIVMEVLQGITDDTAHEEIKDSLFAFPIHSAGGIENCMKSAALFRQCRKGGLTIRKSIDCLLATLALEQNLEIFHLDRDFDLIAKVSSLKTHQF